MRDSYEDFKSWCYERHIFFYPFPEDCEPGFCKVIKWVNGHPTIGAKQYKEANIKYEINELYKKIYQLNNP